MSALRWTQVFLTLLFTASTSQFSIVSVRAGAEVTLPCENQVQDHDKCLRTSWNLIYFPNKVVQLIHFGQIFENPKVTADKLRLTGNCSLVIKDVTDEEVGFYICRRVLSGRHEDARVRLSVVHMAASQSGDRTALNCSVSTYGDCGHTVKWLHRGQTLEDDQRDVEASPCSAAVALLTSDLLQTSPELQCEVTNHYSGKVQQFDFSPQTSGGDTTTTQGGKKPTRAGCSVLDFIMLLMRVAELLLITAITVLLFRASGKQSPPDDHAVHHEGGKHGGSVKYENVRVPPAAVSSAER